MKQPRSLKNINPILKAYLLKKDPSEHPNSVSKERKSILCRYFDFLAEIFQLPSGSLITDKEIDATSRDMIRRYVHFLKKERNNSDATIHLKLSTIRLFYKEYKSSNPNNTLIDDLFADFPLPKDKKQPKYLKKNDYYIRFFQNIGGLYQIRDRLLVALMMTMGLTPTEICALNCDDIIDLESIPYLHLTSRTLPTDEACEDPFLTDRQQKVLLPINQPTAVLLQEWAAIRPDLPKECLDQPLFLSKFKHRLNPSAIEFILKNHALKMHLNPEHTSSDNLRRLAIHLYTDYGGSEAGLLKYFGCSCIHDTQSKHNPQAFLSNPFIDALASILS